jgi:hypothetical protein
MKTSLKGMKGMSAKSMTKGPKKPMPNDPAIEAIVKEGQRKNVKKGLKIGVPILGTMVGVSVPAMTRRPAEARLDAKGSRQESRAGRKTVRANRIEETKPEKAAKLREKAASLNAKGAANKKAAEIIYKSKQNKK